MKNAIQIILRDNRILCKRADEDRLYAFIPEGITAMPCIPFYYFLFESKSGDAFARFFKESFQTGKFLKCGAVVALPEDAIFIDESILTEFFIQCFAKDVRTVRECLLLTNAADEYLSVTETCRMTVLRHIKNKAVQNTAYLENRTYAAEEMKTKIRSLHPYGDLPVFLNGVNLSKYGELGKTVKPETMFENFNSAIDVD